MDITPTVLKCIGMKERKDFRRWSYLWKYEGLKPKGLTSENISTNKIILLRPCVLSSLYIFIYIYIYIYIYYYSLRVFHWNLSDSKSPQVTRTLLSILADLNIAVVWMVSTCPPSSKLSSPFINTSVTVPRTPITIRIIVIFMFHSFFNSLARFGYLSFFSLFFNFTLWSAGTA